MPAPADCLLIRARGCECSARGIGFQALFSRQRAASGATSAVTRPRSGRVSESRDGCACVVLPTATVEPRSSGRLRRPCARARSIDSQQDTCAASHHSSEHLSARRAARKLTFSQKRIVRCQAMQWCRCSLWSHVRRYQSGL